MLHDDELNQAIKVKDQMLCALGIVNSAVLIGAVKLMILLPQETLVNQWPKCSKWLAFYLILYASRLN